MISRVQWNYDEIGSEHGQSQTVFSDVFFRIIPVISSLILGVPKCSDKTWRIFPPGIKIDMMNQGLKNRAFWPPNSSETFPKGMTHPLAMPSWPCLMKGSFSKSFATVIYLLCGASDPEERSQLEGPDPEDHKEELCTHMIFSTSNISNASTNNVNPVYDGLPKCLFLVLLINRNSLRAASYLLFKTMAYLNCLKPCILSFTFEAVAKTCSKC